MSLLDKNAAFKYLRGGNNQNQQGNRNSNSGGNNQKRPQHNSGRAAQQNNQRQQGLASKAKEICRRFGDDEETQTNETTSSQQGTENMVSSVKEVLSAFTSAFEKNVDKPAELKSLIEDSFEDVVAAMRFYYDPRFEDALPEMNRLLDIMSTNHFASILLGILKQDPFDNWVEMWKDVALTISILLETSSKKMKDGTIQIYVSDILASSGMWKAEITQMVEEIGITDELAIDLVIGLPVKPGDMNDLMMRSTYQTFLACILEHADENIEVLDRNAQRKLFDFFFDDKPGNGGKLALKVIGRYLSDGVPEEELSAAASLIYAEFKAMLYEKLETYDVNNIAFALRFIVDQRKRNETAETIFNAEDAAKYDTIRKAIMQVISKDETAKEYLV